jgi:class 3 adenylate cyclase
MSISTKRLARNTPGSMPPDLPTGTVTFQFTDIEGSTWLLDELGPDGCASALAEHRAVIRVAAAAPDGIEVDTAGDAFLVAVPTLGTGGVTDDEA